ncbi:MAG: TlpA disulfide reductase family protein [Chitinophagaceae bacterium]
MSTYPFLRKNLFSIFMVALVATLLFVPDAKAFLLKGLLKTGIFNARTKKIDPLQQTAVSISFVDSNGQHVNTGDLKGKCIFINFWATWCPPCIAEMGSINALYNKLKKDDRFVFIAADADNNLVQSIAFMKKHGYSLPVYSIAGIPPGNLFNGVLPTTLIIDTRGTLAQQHEGIANYDTEKMITFLKGLLRDSPLAITETHSGANSTK